MPTETLPIQYTLFDDEEEYIRLSQQANQKIIDDKKDEVKTRVNQIVRWNQDVRNP